MQNQQQHPLVRSSSGVDKLMNALRKNFHELNPIAERIIDVHAVIPLEGLIAPDTDASVADASDQVR